MNINSTLVRCMNTEPAAYYMQFENVYQKWNLNQGNMKKVTFPSLITHLITDFFLKENTIIQENKEVAVIYLLNIYSVLVDNKIISSQIQQFFITGVSVKTGISTPITTVTSQSPASHRRGQSSVQGQSHGIVVYAPTCCEMTWGLRLKQVPWNDLDDMSTCGRDKCIKWYRGRFCFKYFTPPCSLLLHQWSILVHYHTHNQELVLQAH